MLECVQWFWEMKIELPNFNYINLLRVFSRYEQPEIVDLIMRKIFLPMPVLGPERDDLLHIAAMGAPFEVFQCLRSKFTVTVWYVPPYLVNTIKAFRFLAFDDFYESAVQNADPRRGELVKVPLPITLVINALQSRLPVAEDNDPLVKKAPDNQLLEPAASNGYLNIIKEFGLCNIVRHSKHLALSAAARYRQSATFKYITDNTEFISYDDLYLVVKVLIEYKDRDSLHYLIAKQFGANISLENKIQILLEFILMFESMLTPMARIKKFLSDFVG